MESARTKKLHRAAELAAYKAGLIKSRQQAQQEERFLRLAAEFDNFKKRTAKQFEEIVKNANEELMLDVLDVLDDFHRALDSLSSDDPSGGEGNYRSLVSGMKMIYDKLYSILKERGVKAIDAIDKPFDPKYHDAVMQMPSEKEEGTVVAVVSPGYMLNDKVLRHAKVAVASSKDKE